MDKNDILAGKADTILEAPVRFKVDILYPTPLEKLLIRIKLSKPVRSFELRPMVLGKLIQISKLLLSVDEKLFDQKNLLASNCELAVRHGRSIATIVAIAVSKEKTASEELVDFFETNLTIKELFQAALIVLKQMDVGHFMSSIISLKGIKILDMSQNTEEIIASGPPLEELSSTTALAGKKSSGSVVG